MLNIDDIPLLFGYPVETTPSSSFPNIGYFDETHILVCATGANVFILVTEDNQGKPTVTANVVANVYATALAYTDINFRYFCSCLQGVQGFDNTHFLSICQTNNWSIKDAFEEITSYLRRRCDMNCKHIMIRSNGECMVCAQVVLPQQAQTTFSWMTERTPRMETTPVMSPDDVRAHRKQMGVCPDCGDPGKWVGTALVCDLHGFFAGC